MLATLDRDLGLCDATVMACSVLQRNIQAAALNVPALFLLGVCAGQGVNQAML